MKKEWVMTDDQVCTLSPSLVEYLIDNVKGYKNFPDFPIHRADLKSHIISFPCSCFRRQ